MSRVLWRSQDREAQGDWGQQHLGLLAENGAERKLWGFTITLGYSRMMTAEAR
jgi:hypothetical protein